ncbi:LPXTG cell wall anchor domain-containing protein [Streptomyces apricus]|uniref:LPXTG cell wall anchor domain-containing protein n=1 Tax=Streptomyces apricus TaxID=1828112 RepID=A0A5B0B3H8_9ACTN|nr:LPXTG cell wall anchor domain-containing protein [Streptomyces apricus]
MLTATAAGTLLGALWFVPSAKATDDLPPQPAQHRTQTTTTRVVNTAAHTSSGTSQVSARSATDTTTSTAADTSTSTGTTADGAPAGPQTRLADTGSFDTTPYVAGGTVLLALGAGFVAYSVRRERMTL